MEFYCRVGPVVGGGGGCWERMVKGVKQPLKKTVGRSTLDYDELQTAVMEIRAIVNARPLTYVYDDEESVSTSLTRHI